MAIIGSKRAVALLDDGLPFAVVVGTLVAELQLTNDQAVRATVNAEHHRLPIWRRR